MTVIVSIVVLGLLIFVHEFGHFLLAKLNKIGVYEFSIGFGKKLWRRRIGNSYYAIGIVPLGGYVSMAGDDPALVLKTAKKEELAEDSEADDDLRAKLDKDPLARELIQDESCWFLTKPYFSKLSVVLAGPLFNYFFAIILSIISYAIYGALEVVPDPVIGDIIPGFAAEKSGLKAEDKILSINGVGMNTWEEVANFIASSGGKELNVQVERPVKTAETGVAVSKEVLEIKVAASLDYQEYAVVRGEENNRYRIGITQSMQRKTVSNSEAVINGALHVWGITVMTFRGIKGMIEGAISPKHIAGPIFIFSTAAKSAKKGLEHLLSFIVFLSVSLAILNLLPIPVLDGGHVLFFTIEAIIRKPLSLRVQQVATQIGVLFLLVLTLFAVGNDIIRLL